VKNIQEALEDYSDKAREQHIAELSAAEVARTQNIMQVRDVGLPRIIVFS
jgi:hypothetical protein